MTMWPYVSSPQQHVQKPVWIIGRVGMEIVIHPKARRFRGKRRNGVEERGRDQFHFSHRFQLNQLNQRSNLDVVDALLSL